MIKHLEISDPKSCLNKALSDEPVFVLRSKDPVAVQTVLFWVQQRVGSGLNRLSDPKIQEALEWCRQSEEYHEQNFEGPMIPPYEQ